MSHAIHDLEQRGRVDGPTIDAFLASHQFPLVEDTTVTFVYRGRADAVLLRHWIFGLPSTQPFQRLMGSDLWYTQMTLPPRSRVEYKIELHRGPHRELIHDPLNPLLARDPYGANSVVHATGYEAPDWVHEDPEARRGAIQEHRIFSHAFGEHRPLSVYLPARFRTSRRYPLLVLHDGVDYLRFASLQTVLDNLIHRLEIPSMVVALIQSPDRLREYADDERHARFLADDLLPALESMLPLLPRPETRGLAGASFGAVASLAAALRRPGVWGNLLLQSGSFAFTDIGDHDRGPLFDPIVKFVNDFRANPRKPAEKIFLTCGTYESLIYYNRALLPILQATGSEVRYEESRDGHNWENWRDRLRNALTWLAPGPLWMVYE